MQDHEEIGILFLAAALIVALMVAGDQLFGEHGPIEIRSGRVQRPA